MPAFKEIVTKAVIGKGKKQFTDNLSLQVTNSPNTILGCWVINHNFSGSFSNGTVTINGSYDVNIWYSYDNDTKTTVTTKTIDYREVVNVSTRANSDTTNRDIIVRSLKQPSCVNAKENGNSIEFDIEKELGIEIVGDTKVKIAIEDDEEPWDIIPDDNLSNEVEKEIDNSVKEDYLDKK